MKKIVNIVIYVMLIVLGLFVAFIFSTEFKEVTYKAIIIAIGIIDIVIGVFEVVMEIKYGEGRFTREN